MRCVVALMLVRTSSCLLKSGTYFAASVYLFSLQVHAGCHDLGILQGSRGKMASFLRLFEGEGGRGERVPFPLPNGKLPLLVLYFKIVQTDIDKLVDDRQILIGSLGSLHTDERVLRNK